ncbi:MAG: DoxX family protein [Cecembia sp.]
MIQKLLILTLGLFFIIAGINHFIQPEFYIPLIPSYVPWPGFINHASGVMEIFLGLGVLMPSGRKVSAWGIMVLMILFIPSHVYFIQIGSCVPNGLCVPPWLAWLRLVLIHPLLMVWAFYVSKTK